ncbi:MAG: DUF4294 domain-containing protein [Bacteroidales bacterium]|jgi:hypothetical protein|nr:DUF4294 domain-containing protein [Bacteroidales bacterium]MDN5350064.1 hypothetical protein [Bacteroidales bacterium]
MMRVSYVFIFFLLLIHSQGWSQQTTDTTGLADTLVVLGKVEHGDTTLIMTLPEVNVFAMRLFDSRRDIRKVERLIYHVKKVYPYAKLAGIKLREYDKQLVNAKNDRDRRRIMRKAEKEINEEFGGELRNLTFTQGKILLKLIDRETGNTSYDLVKELRGGFTAFFYQGFARIWGYNLKSDYDPNGEDELIETIVTLIEHGQL